MFVPLTYYMDWIKQAAGNIVVGWIFGLLYVTGLALLFPFVYFLQISGPTSPSILITAAILIVASFFGFLGRYGDISISLKVMGRITLIPGLIGIIFSVFGRRIILSALEGQQLAQEAVTVLTAYLDNAVPKIRILTVLYILLGIFLWYLGSKFER